MASVDSPPTAFGDALPAEPAQALEPERLNFEFSGSGGEYFRIWIVNILLTTLTLGIYSAWAKVRNKRYFYGSTSLEGASFEYTANPVNILKGRILVVAVVILYQFVIVYAPIIAGTMAVGLIFLFPWVINQALAFNARYSSYRNLRFQFDRSYPEAFRYYILWTVFSAFTLGLAYPYAIFLRKRFTVGRSRYGATPFEFSGRARYFYLVYVLAALVLIGLFVGIFVVLGGLMALTGGFGGSAEGAGEPAAGGAMVFVSLAMNLALLAVLLGTAIVVQTAITNHVLQHTAIGGIRLDMRMNPLMVLWIQLSNVVAIVLSFGMLIPWARVRIVRYRLSCLSALATVSLDDFLASERERVAATGEEMGEVLDLDLGL